MTQEQQREVAANDHATAQWKEHPEERNASFENWQNCKDDFVAGAEWEANQVKWIHGLPNDQEIIQLMCDREVSLIYGSNITHLEMVGLETDDRVIKMAVFASFKEAGDFTDEQIQLAINKIKEK